LNSRHTLAEHLAILADAGATALFIGPQFFDVAAELAKHAADLRVLPLGWRLDASLDF